MALCVLSAVRGTRTRYRFPCTCHARALFVLRPPRMRKASLYHTKISLALSPVLRYNTITRRRAPSGAVTASLRPHLGNDPSHPWPVRGPTPANRRGRSIPFPFGAPHFQSGDMSEWPKEARLKRVNGQPFVGSNPTISATAVRFVQPFCLPKRLRPKTARLSFGRERIRACMWDFAHETT